MTGCILITQHQRHFNEHRGNDQKFLAVEVAQSYLITLLSSVFAVISRCLQQPCVKTQIGQRAVTGASSIMTRLRDVEAHMHQALTLVVHYEASFTRMKYLFPCERIDSEENKLNPC